MFTFHLIDESNARTILSWRYEPPYDFYNDSDEDASLLLLIKQFSHASALHVAPSRLQAYSTQQVPVR